MLKQTALWTMSGQNSRLDQLWQAMKYSVPRAAGIKENGSTMIEQRFANDDIELLDRKSCYEGFFSLQIFKYRHRRFDGSWSRTIHREVFVRGDATCVLPYDPVTGQVLLIEQIRAGALLEQDQTPWLIELIAGMNDKNEKPETIAQREAEEEAGIVLDRLELISAYFPSPGGATEKVTLFCAKADLSDAGGVYGLAEEDEDIRVHVLPLEQAYAMVGQGSINNAPAIIALQWLMINQQEVAHRWSSQTV